MKSLFHLYAISFLRGGGEGEVDGGEDTAGYDHEGLEGPDCEGVGCALGFGYAVEREGKHHGDVPRAEATVGRYGHAA